MFQKSPKFFIVYAHDNKGFPDHKANAEVVKNFIGWFKWLLFNVDSDKSPHGWGPVHETAHVNASQDIIANQLCLLPREWDERNVDETLLYGSELLGAYLEAEQSGKIGTETYTEAISRACIECDREPTEQRLRIAEEKIREIQATYSKKMGGSFHHVLTELGLLRFRYEREQKKSTIPILLGGDYKTCFPEFIAAKESTLRVEVDSQNQHRSLFKILLMFEDLETDRKFIESFEKCYSSSVIHLEDNKLEPLTYHRRSEEILLKTLRGLRKGEQYKKVERRINRGAIREILDSYAGDRSHLRRLSGDPLPEDLGDISLVLVPEVVPSVNEQPQASSKEDDLVPIHQLFKDRELKKKDTTTTIRPKRILIHGRPGVGKSTLCRRLMQEYSLNKELRNQFALVLQVPLWKLGNISTLAGLFYEEYFQLMPRADELSEALQNVVLKPQDLKILFILDGLDETRAWPEQKRRILTKLLNQPMVIITSRSKTIGGLEIDPVDLNLEAIGLSTKSISAYLKQKTIISSENTAAQIQRFIREHEDVQEMVQVPMHLDMLCYSWNELQGTMARTAGAEAPTITTLYEAIVHKLWRNDIPKLGKTDHGEQLIPEIVDSVRDPLRLERVVQLEEDFLEELAMDLMQRNRIECTDRDVSDLIRQMEDNRKSMLPLSLERNLEKLSFLRSTFGQYQKNYTFTHFTFNEFFAARYLTRSQDRLKTHLSKHKYDPRYQLIWRFVAGLLPGGAALDGFFDLLEQEPQDLLGIHHQYLIMHCVNESRERVHQKRRKDLETTLLDWLMFQGVGEHRLGNSFAFPESKLLELLDDESDRCFETATVVLTKRPFLSEDATKTLIDLFCTGTRRGFICSRWILRHHRILPPKAITTLIELLGSHEPSIRSFAMGVLGKQSDLSNDAVNSLVDILKDTARRMVRSMGSTFPSMAHSSLADLLGDISDALYSDTTRVLSEHTGLAGEVVDDLITLLEDVVAGHAAWTALRGQRSLSEGAVNRLFDILRSADRAAQDRAATVLQVQVELPVDVVERLGNLLSRQSQKRRHGEPSMHTVILALSSQAKLPTSTLNVLATVLLTHFRLREEVAQVFCKQSNLTPEVLENLKISTDNSEADLFCLMPRAMALKGRLCLLSGLRERLLEAISEDYLLRHEPKTNPTSFDAIKAAEILSEEPGFLPFPLQAVYGLIGLWHRDHYRHTEYLMSLLGKQPALESTAIGRLISVLNLVPPLEGHYLAVFIRNQPDLSSLDVNRLIDLVIDSQSLNAADALRGHPNLPSEIVDRLVRQVEIENTRGSAASIVLSFQLKLPDKAIELFCKLKEWDSLRQRTEQLYGLLETLEVSTFLAFMVPQDLEMQPLCIEDGTLRFYDSSGAVKEVRLSNETTFRQRWRSTQVSISIPKGSLVKVKAKTAAGRVAKGRK